MFNKERFNIKEIEGILLEYPRADIIHPHTAIYSSDTPFLYNELVIYLDGKSVYTINDMTFEFTKGDILFIPSGSSRKKYIVESVEPVAYVVIYFTCNDITPTVPKIFRNNSEAVLNKFLKIGKIWLLKKDGYYTKAMALLYDIISDIQSFERNYIPQKQFEALKKSIKYLENNYYKKDFDYTHLAELSGFSYAYFKKLFIKKYGSSPVKHITNMRINLAKDLITSEKYKISEIADICGFQDVYYFSSTFKKITGVSPSKYKNSH